MTMRRCFGWATILLVLVGVLCATTPLSLVAGSLVAPHLDRPWDHAWVEKACHFGWALTWKGAWPLFFRPALLTALGFLFLSLAGKKEGPDGSAPQ